ncbi:unnamed protein product [Boreogadus saida]
MAVMPLDVRLGITMGCWVSRMAKQVSDCGRSDQRLHPVIRSATAGVATSAFTPRHQVSDCGRSDQRLHPVIRSATAGVATSAFTPSSGQRLRA